MNRFILFALFFAMTNISYGQSLPKLIALYEADCNKMVLDTIEQSGTITYETVPVLIECC